MSFFSMSPALDGIDKRIIVINDPDPTFDRRVGVSMSTNEPDDLGSVSVQVTLKGPAISGPVTVHIGSPFQLSDRESSHQEKTGEHNLPKYACRQCGSDEVRGDLDTYQVYRADGDRLFHLRSEFTDPAILALYCNSCGEKLEIDDLGEIQFE